ncbi:MAG: hypothetical protein AMXMBFR46_23100 [Acidimicrobiia bacterium]
MGFQRIDGVLHQTVEGRAMTIAPVGEEVITLNPTGTIVWDALGGTTGGGGTVDAATLVAAVCQRFPDAPVDAVTADVGTFLAELEAAGLIRPG